MHDLNIGATIARKRRAADGRPSAENNMRAARGGAIAVAGEGVVLRVEGLGCSYAGMPVFSGASFELRAGEVAFLTGPNGAGKSTTFRMLCGLSRPTAGECFVAGMNLLTAGGAARAKLGYMAQKFSLYGELTVQQNMRLMADLYGLERGRVKPRIEQLVEALDLETFRDVRAFNLPLGQKQRLAMACATLHEPPVLFLDEPTSGVDPGRAGNSGSTSTP